MSEETGRVGADVDAAVPWWSGRDVRWLSLSLGVFAVVTASYLATHGHPAYEGGLFLQIVEEIQRHGYAPPRTIPHYTDGGVPFAYPPLWFYVVAVLVDLTGIDPLVMMQYGPALAMGLALVPYFYVARALLDSTRRAGIATVLFAATPEVLRWHISAGGLVRAPALVLALAGIYAGVRIFVRGDHRFAVPGAVLFGLTVLSHPHYAAFFGVSYLVLYFAYDRTLQGLVVGAAVATAGVVIAAPWWVRVATTYGPETIFAAAGSHKGLGGGYGRFRAQFVRPVLEANVASPFYVVAFLGSAVLLARRRFAIPAWLLASTLVIGKARFLFVTGSMASAVALHWAGDRLATTARRFGHWSPRHTRVRAVLVALAIIGAATVGVLYAGSALQIAHHDSDTQPQTVDDADRDAMRWARTHTGPSASFVVLGDTAEWFPYLAERTGLVGPWGVEWTTAERYYREIEVFQAASTCPTATCLAETLAEAGRHPDYVYVPKGEYTVRGKEYRQAPMMLATLSANPRYRVAYENEGVVVFAVTPYGERGWHDGDDWTGHGRFGG